MRALPEPCLCGKVSHDGVKIIFYLFTSTYTMRANRQDNTVHKGPTGGL